MGWERGVVLSSLADCETALIEEKLPIGDDEEEVSTTSSDSTDSSCNSNVNSI